MHPPFSPRGENGPCTVQKTRQEGDFGLGPPLRRYDSRPLLGPPIVPLPRKSARFIRRRRRFADFPPPNYPFKRPKEGAAAHSLETPPKLKRHSLRHKRNLIGALQRTRMELGKLAESWLSAVRIPNLARTGKFGRKAFFFWTVHGPFSFSRKRKWGVRSPSHADGCVKTEEPYGTVKRKQHLYRHRGGLLQ